MQKLYDIFDSFKDKKVLIVGDVILDSYIHGTVNRISPEAPVPIVTTQRKEQRLGGAANVAMNIRALGAVPILCSVVGDDRAGEAFEKLLDEQQMPKKGIIKSQQRVTTTKLRIVSEGQHLLRADTEDTFPLSSIDQKSLLHHIRNLLKEVDLVIFEDFDKGTINPEVIEKTIEQATSLHIPIAVDPKRKYFPNYTGVSLFKVNVSDLQEGLEFQFDAGNESELNEAVYKLKKSVAAQNYFLTLSRQGIYYSSKEGRVSGKLPAHPRDIVEVLGAGDTVIAIAGLCLTGDVPLEVMAELANIGGGLACEAPGVSPIDRETLLAEAQNSDILKKYV